jgi:hypothetical protein
MIADLLLSTDSNRILAAPKTGPSFLCFMTTIVAWNNVLWYLKGGAAVSLDKYNGIANFTAGGGTAELSLSWSAMGGARLDPGQHHAALTLRAAWPFGRK